MYKKRYQALPAFPYCKQRKAGRGLGARLASCCREWQMLIDNADHKHGHSLIKWVPHLCLVSMQCVPPIGALLQLSDTHGIDVLYCLLPGNCLHAVIELCIGVIMDVFNLTIFHSAFLLPCPLLRSLGHSSSHCQAFPTSSFWLLVVRSKKGGKLQVGPTTHYSSLVSMVLLTFIVRTLSWSMRDH